MPKVNINKREYKSKDIGNHVVLWLRRAGKRMEDLAEELGISQPAVSYKIKNSSFTVRDLIVIFDYLGVPEEEIIFTLKV